MNDYAAFYKELLEFQPYDYQCKVAELLLNGKNVILSVPTGAGKTLASVMPFLYAKSNRIFDFPQKMIYSLPLRTLANSIYNDINNLLDKPDLVSIQTGEYGDDPYFEKDIIFSTIDQTLSNYLCFPLAISHGQANINAGSIIGSYLVFDEFHLLDSKLSMATTIGMLRMLKNLCRICIMTATLTDNTIDFLKRELDNFEVVSIDDFPNDKCKIKSLIPAIGKNVKKSNYRCDAVLSATEILKKHKNKTIVICNRVETAQRIYLELNKHKEQSTNIICIHSRYFDSDRKQKEVEIKEWFGKGSKKENVILVSTQVIEAGMDISCDTMFTEISPINSFLQRAGRCARFENEYGEVYVCDVLSLDEKDLLNENNASEQDSDEIKKLNNKYLPYSKNLCEKSFKSLINCHYIDEIISKKLVNDIHSEEDKNKLNVITNNLYNQDEIRTSWLDCDKKHYRETIRDIQSIELILFDVENNQDKKVIPWKYESISVYRWSFIGWVKKMMDENANSDNWIIAKAEQGNESKFDFDWQDKNDYYLKRLDFSEIKNYYDVVFVNNRYFDYNAAGLIVANNGNGNISPLKKVQEKDDTIIVYKKDTLYQHNKALLNCYEKEFKPNINFLFCQLNKYWGSEVDWDKIIKTTIIFHDYGKLNTAWQKPMLEFQRRKMNDDTYFEILAHTDYDKSTDMELAKECHINTKPAHSGIGAVQVYDMLYDDYGEKIAKIVACAILKHHSVNTSSFETFAIFDNNLNDLLLLTQEYKIKGAFNKGERGDTLKDITLNRGNDKEWLLYLLIVRILRLCDQKSTESIEKYYTI